MRTGPLIYSCSGCSSVAQLANHIAVRLDRLAVAEMSCVAGLGADVAPLVQLARRGRPLVALDGCPLHCVRGCMARHDLTPSLHVTLTELGVRKRPHMDFDPDDANRLVGVLTEQVKALTQ